MTPNSAPVMMALRGLAHWAVVPVVGGCLLAGQVGIVPVNPWLAPPTLLLLVAACWVRGYVDGCIYATRETLAIIHDAVGPELMSAVHLGCNDPNCPVCPHIYNEATDRPTQ